jgi:hypothetical protein
MLTLFLWWTFLSVSTALLLGAFLERGSHGHRQR